MKLIIFLLSVSFSHVLIAQSLPENYPNWPNLDTYALEGRVKTVSSETVFPEGIPTILTPGIAAQVPGIDSFGNIDMEFDSLGRATTITYIPESFTDKKKNAPRTVTTFYDGALALYTVNKEGDKITDSIAYDYGRYDRLNSYQVYDQRSKLRYRYTYTYNGERQLTTIRRRNEENYPVEMIKVKYDDQGAIAAYHYYDDNMKLVRTASFNETVTDSTINGTVLINNDSAQLSSGTMTVKNLKGWLLQESAIDRDRKVTAYNTFRYNEHGNVEEAKLFANMENLEVTYIYKYDEQGNWTSRNIHINGLQGPLTLRRIKYYP